MNAKPRENRSNQQKSSSRQKQARRDSSGDDELTTGDYEKEMLVNSRTRDLEPGAKKAKASSPAQKTAKSSPGRERGPRGARGKMREQIKRVAESQFMARGYDGTTMRSIAKGAGCDPAMVSYYFGSKQRLFRDCFDLPLDPLQQILQLWEPGLEGIADRLLDFAFTLYEERLTKDRMKALMRALITDSETTQRFRAYMSVKRGRGSLEYFANSFRTRGERGIGNQFSSAHRNSNVHDLRGGNDALYRPVRAGSLHGAQRITKPAGSNTANPNREPGARSLPLASSGYGSKRKRKLNRREIARRLAAVTLCLPPS